MKKNRIGARSGGRIFVRKWMMMMKFVFIFLICSLVQVQAAVYSQQSKVSVELKNVTLEKVFQELERQTGYSFLYNHRVIEVRGKVSVQVVDKELGVVLDDLLTKLGLGFTFDDNLVIIKEQPRIWGQDSVRKSLRIVGKVVDEKKLPMPGVTVKVVGLPVGTATNEKGRFAIELPLVKGTLEFSFVGFKKKIIEFSEKTAKDTLRIVMEEDVQALDETVVVAYGTTTRREATGAISVVKADELKGIPSTSIAGLLQGRVAGLDITQMSGSPGGGGTAIVIRGYNSFDISQQNRFSDPLWVVDGVPLNAFDSPVTGTNLLSDINPDMIESIQVLKDASAASLYGSRAANGVIIVTTKKGRKNMKATFSANVSYSWSWVPELPTITVGKGERNTRLLALANTKTAYYDPLTQMYKYPISNEEVFEKKEGSFDYFFSAFSGGPAALIYQDSLNSFYNNQTNFFPTYFRTGRVLNANMQTYGGGENMNYGIGLGFYDESGVFVGTGFQRVDLNATLNVTPVNRLNVDLRMNASLLTRDRGEKTDELGWAAPSIEVVPGDPYWLSSLYPGEGSESWQATLDALRGTKEKNRAVRLRSNFKIGYDVIPGLNVSVSLAADYSIHRRNYFQPSYLDNDGFSKSIGETSINLMVLNENLVSYQKIFKEEHSLSLMAGFSYEYDQMEYNGGSAENSPSDKIYYAPSGMPDIGYIDQWGQQVPVAFQHYRSDMVEKKLMSYFGRLEYNYKKKYLFSVSYRRDGSSVFGKDCRWGAFPSVAAGWTFSEENFIKGNFGWLSFGKLRASWGKSGKQFEDAYLALGLMTSGMHSEYGNSILLPNEGGGLFNNDLSWEETDQYDFGLDLDLFNHRFGVILDYYYRYTDKLLFPMPLVGDYNGYVTQWRNAGAISNEGLELLIKYEILCNSDFYWKISINGAKNWNRVEKSETGKDLNTGLVIGKPLNRIQGFLTQGFINQQGDVAATFSSGGENCYLYPNTGKSTFYTLGDYKFIDVNGDGEIDYDDYVSLGSALPIVNGGIVNEFQWKNFDLNLVMHYSVGRHMVNQLDMNSLAFITRPDHMYYAHPLLLDIKKVSFWKETGDNDAKYPLFQMAGKYQYGSSSVLDRQVENVNYLKFKTLTIGYNLRGKFVERWGISQLRMFVTGENLWTWTNYSGIDPETVSIQTGIDSGLNYPLARRFTLGLTVKF
ncbi:SusC/RagA family TonB-linked outer membrane protein [Butyricimonas sp. Marseille-P3923]|uniref:SusC/RagA family TonB-linked outer membrane protein n=1 Tax=Butyricimonas sp. Marseille-P3923 TaxID=1987504 RepID=UPI0021001B4F|nr:SusC/RagA family TonB-linked outer membrane protein [Butyricimonas sp. Marseille-P3923]